MTHVGPRSSSKLAPSRLHMAPNRLHVALGWPNFAPSRHQVRPNRLEFGPRWPSDCLRTDIAETFGKPMKNNDCSCFLHPSWRQQGSKFAHVGIRATQVGDRWRQMHSMLLQVWPKLDPRPPNNIPSRPNIVPR